MILRRKMIWSFHSLHRHVVVLRARGQVCGQVGQFVVMRREERAGADLVVQMLGDAPRDAQAVEGARAAADLIEDDQAALGGVVEDVRRSRSSRP